ncbi:tetratricopeptide repeat protein, partial [Candidatus Poribacteria bacterium]|nr:tetratricopeptide repeat protein [Candidatus Poribacteria bacterium]
MVRKMRRTIYNYCHIALLICLALIIFMGNLLGDQLGPYIGYIADARYDEIIQQFLLRAATEYEIAKIKDPDSAITHNNLGVVYRIKSELKDAESEFNTALRKDEKFAGATMNLGVVLAAQGRIEEAIATHLRAMDNAPDWLKP